MMVRPDIGSLLRRYGGVILILGVGLAVRLPWLWGVPLFNDEAIYLERALSFPGDLRITLEDGKLLAELALALLVRLPGDPLWWGRGFSLLCGAGVVLLLGVLGSALGRPGAGRLAGLLYALTPVAALHDSLALPDSLLTLLGCLLLLACLRFARSPSRASAGVVGVALSLAALAKISGVLLFWAPLAAACWFARSRRDAWERAQLLRVSLIVLLGVLAVLAGLFHYGGAEVHKVGGGEGGSRGLVLARVFDWLLRELPLPLLLPPALALALGRHQRDECWRAIGWLLSAGLALIATYLVVGNILYPRYLLPALPMLLLATGLATGELWAAAGRWRPVARWAAGAAIGVALVWGGGVAAVAAGDPRGAVIAPLDRDQYFDTWTAGNHVDDLIMALRHEADLHGSLTIVNHWLERLVHLVPQIYLRNDPRIKIVTVDLTQPDALEQLDAWAGAGPTLLLVDEEERTKLAIDQRFPQIRQIAIFRAPNGPMAFYIYAVQGG